MMHEIHRRVAELHELAAHAHRTAAEHNEMSSDPDAENPHLKRALDYSDQAYRLAQEAHNKSGQMVTV